MTDRRQGIEHRQEGKTTPHEASASHDIESIFDDLITNSVRITSAYIDALCDLLISGKAQSVDIELQPGRASVCARAGDSRFVVNKPPIHVVRSVLNHLRSVAGIRENAYGKNINGLFADKANHTFKVVYSNDLVRSSQFLLICLDDIPGKQEAVSGNMLPYMPEKPEQPPHRTYPERQSVTDRLRTLDNLAGSPVSSYVRDLFPEIVELERAEAEGRTAWVSRVGEKAAAKEPEHPPLPEQAPTRWAEAKEPGDTPPVFIQRHYAPWLGKGLTRADVRHLDPQLSMALSNWQRKHELPEGFDKLLPTKSDHLRLTDQQRSSELIEAKRHAWRLDKRRSRTEQER